MKPNKTVKLYNVSAFLGMIVFILIFATTGYGSGWKAGVARSVITPEEPIWMAGYAARDRPSEGTLHDLWAKALALEDANGHRVVLITTDLLGFPQAMSNRIRDQIATEFGLTRPQVVLSSSHTHSGPVLMDALFNIYPLDEQRIEVIRRYSENLEKKIVHLTGEALRLMVPAQLFSENGIARFQVNRRHNNEKTLMYQSELKGPSDHAVPVIKVADASDNLMAIVFGYACHTTVLTINQFSGDYAGFAQVELEKLHPGATAMFFQGAGADQNPIPRRTVPLARQYGRELAAAVDRVLNEEMKKLAPVIKTAYTEIDLSFSRHPTMEQLIEIEKEAQGYQKRWASEQINILKGNGKFPASYPFPLQVWKLGDQLVFILGGELVVEYALELKKLFGHDIFVMGYANDVMAYIPSETILKEGLYEGETSQAVYGMPAKWETGIQEKIINELKQMAVKAGIGR
jgi:neutral ceramidase